MAQKQTKQTKKQIEKKELGKISFLPDGVNPESIQKVFECVKHGIQESAISLDNQAFYCSACLKDFFKKNKIEEVQVKKKLINFDEFTSIAKRNSVNIPVFPRKNSLECPFCQEELEDTDGKAASRNPLTTKIQCSGKGCTYKSARLVV